MKRPFLSLAIGLLLIATPTLATVPGGESDITPLSNRDVLTMVQSHLSEDVIIKAIKSSPCTFDTFPPVLRDMKRRGVSDRVLQAMIDAPYGPTSGEMVAVKDEAGEQPIYHYADQLRAMGYIAPSAARRNNQFRQPRTRAARRRQ